jgi:transposase
MKGKPIWVGLDAGTEKVSGCALDHRGAALAEWTVGACATAISSVLRSLPASSSLTIGIEAGSTSTHLTRLLRNDGFDVRVLETRRLNGFLRVRQNKTDVNDARGIAEATRIGLGIIPEVLVKSAECQALRSELVLRSLLMHQRISVTNAIRAVLRLNGGKIGIVSSGAALQRLVSGEISRLRGGGTDLTEMVGPALAMAVALHRALEQGERRLKRLAKDSEVCRRFMAVPGVGPICAISFYTAIADPHRFQKSDDVGPYLGLVPRVSQSGQALRRGRISKMGNTLTRTHLVTAAISLMRQPNQDCALRRWALAIAARSGKPKARTALARKLAVVMLAMWKSGESFRPDATRTRPA